LYLLTITRSKLHAIFFNKRRLTSSVLSLSTTVTNFTTTDEEAPVMKTPPLTVCAVAFILGSLSVQAQVIDRTIISSGIGEVSAEPNMAEINLQLEAIDLDGNRAKSDVDERFNRFLTAIIRLDLGGSNVVASTLKLTPNYEYRKQIRVFTGYRASRNVAVTLQRLDLLNELMDIVLASGVDHIGRIQLMVTDEEKYQGLAQQRAIADSKQKATILAKAYGATLGPIKQIQYKGAASHLPQPQYRLASMSRSAMQDEAPGRYIHDQLRFNDHINVIFELIVKN
jgi:uncharacterized protein YggE